MGPRASELALRARASADLAQALLTPDEPSAVPAEPSAVVLYRASAYWALCALASSSNEAAGRSYDVAVWDTLDSAILERAERREPLLEALRSGSFVDFAELPREQQLELCSDMRSLAQALIAKLGQRSLLLDAVYLERAWRLGLLFVVAMALVGAALFVRSAVQDRRDLARSAPWVASSKYPEGGCTSPEQQCASPLGYFFHTNQEQNPWIEFDLGSIQKPAKVQLDNRTDCCTERANPVAIEVSTDHKAWKEVARHDGEFTSWTASFTPVDARWVRIHVPKLTNLHLSRVRIFP